MIPFVKPGINLGIELNEVDKIIKSGQFCLGDYTNRLENSIRNMYKAKYAIACCNATNGLIIAFKAVGIKNMKVGIPAFTWPSTLYALECNNNTPVFFDIDRDTWTMDLHSNKEKVDAIIAVDTFGNPSYIESDVPVIYDAAHSFGAYSIGNRGIVEVMSFSFTKPLVAMQGGIILTSDDKVYEEAKELVRLSAKICEVNALVGLNNMRSYIVRLHDNMKIIGMYKNLIKVPYECQHYNVNGNFSTFAILLENKEKRDNVYNQLKKEGVETKVYYEPLTPGFKNTDEIFSKILCLPVYSQMVLEVPKICKIINGA